MRQEYRRFMIESFPTFHAFGVAFPQNMKKCARVASKVAKGALLIFVILAVVHSVSSFVIGKTLEKRIAAIRAKGEPVECVELAGAKIPDSQNAAVIYDEIFKAREAAMKSVPSRYYQANMNIWSYDYKLLSPEERMKDASLWGAARRVMAGQEKFFALTEEAVARPKCKFAVNWKDGSGALFPYLIYIKQQVRVLCTKALLDARDGKMDDALHNIELAFRVEELLKNEQLLVGQATRWTCIRTAVQGLRDITTYGKISADQGNKLSELLSKIDLRTGLVKGLKGNRTMLLWELDEIRKDPQRLFQMLPNEKQPSGIVAKVAYFVKRPLIYLDEIFLLDAYASYIDAGQRPSREIRKDAKYSDTGKFPWYAQLSPMFMPTFGFIAVGCDANKAEIEGSRIYLALQVYKAKFGTYPASLKDLQSKLGYNLPKDPLSGKDFIYHREPNGYLLYSIGRNLKDDGGVKDENIYNPPHLDDIIWREAQ